MKTPVQTSDEDQPTLIDVTDQVMRMEATVLELAARWHRHENDRGDFIEGMRAGWAQAVAQLLGATTAETTTALRNGVI